MDPCQIKIRKYVSKRRTTSCLKEFESRRTGVGGAFNEKHIRVGCIINKEFVTSSVKRLCLSEAVWSGELLKVERNGERLKW